MKYVFPYQEQMDRIKRLAEDIKRFSVAKEDNIESAIDAFTSFFIQCYHLRDWLFESRYSKRDIDIFINESFPLSLCKDMANRQKHRMIDKYQPAHHLVEHKYGNISSPIVKYYDPERKEDRFGLDIEELGTLVDVIDLSEKCIEEWERFLYLFSI